MVATRRSSTAGGGGSTAAKRPKGAKRTPRSAKPKASAGAKSAKRARQPKKASSTPTPSAAPPPGWREQYTIMEELRAIRDAPVDVFGSEALPERPPAVPAEVFRYQVLIALMLSSQTRDQVVGAAMGRLQSHGLSVQNILATDDDTLRELLFGVGFYNNKTKYIKQTSQILLEKHGGDVPNTAKELCALPGIGPKMAFIILNVAHGVVTGIGIDTHMHRMMNQLRWVKTKTPEQTRLALEAWLPPQEWGSVNLVFVGLGQQVQTEPTKLIARACGCADPEAALRLLRKLDVALDARDGKDRRRTALMQLAAKGGEAASAHVSLLLAAGARSDLKDEDGKTAAELAKPKLRALFE